VPAFSLTAHPRGCLICDQAARHGLPLCFCCGLLVRQLGLPLVPVRSVVGFHIGDDTHRRLRGYKDATVAEARRCYAAQLARMLDRHLDAGLDPWPRVTDGRWELVVTVPSSSRPVGSPVDAIAAASRHLGPDHRTLLRRGPEPTGHLRAARRGFELADGIDRDRLRGRRVLVVDDTLVTGARAQSAAAALRLAGARVVGILTVGRSLAAI
jgi:predicted amidophosphoribosyltransferase